MNYDTFVAAANFNRDRNEIALDLISIFNDGFRPPSNKVTFGLAQPTDIRPDVTGDEDSFVALEIDETYDSRFAGADGFLYRRIDLDSLIPDVTVEINPPSMPFYVWDVLGQINQQLHTQLTRLDVENDLINSNSGFFTLRASLGSIVWLGLIILQIGVVTGVPLGARVTEDGRLRVTEDGRFRVVES